MWQTVNYKVLLAVINIGILQETIPEFLSVQGKSFNIKDLPESEFTGTLLESKTHSCKFSILPFLRRAFQCNSYCIPEHSYTFPVKVNISFLMDLLRIYWKAKGVNSTNAKKAVARKCFVHNSLFRLKIHARKKKFSHKNIDLHRSYHKLFRPVKTF